MSSTEKNVLIPGNFKLGKELFTSALLNNQNEIRTQFGSGRMFQNPLDTDSIYQEPQIDCIYETVNHE